METPGGSAGAAVFGGTVTTPVAAHPGCESAIAEFQAIIDSDEKTGNVNESVYRRIVADLRGVKIACGAGHTGEAARRLAAVKARYGYR
jgi:hypothetical protein